MVVFLSANAISGHSSKTMLRTASPIIRHPPGVRLDDLPSPLVRTLVPPYPYG